MITDYHAKYFTYDLTRRMSAAEKGGSKISTALYDSTVDLNSHQVRGALFALRLPLAKGVISADEVCLGKAIEAGLVLVQCGPDTSVAFWSSVQPLYGGSCLWNCRTSSN